MWDKGASHWVTTYHRVYIYCFLQGERKVFHLCSQVTKYVSPWKCLGRNFIFRFLRVAVTHIFSNLNQITKFLFFIYFFYFLFLNFIFKLYNIVLVLPYIEMNPPQAYTCSPSWTFLPPPSPYHPSGSSQCTSPKHPVLCIEPGLATHFIYDIIHISMPFSQIISPSPSPTESKRLFYTSVSLLLFRIQGYCYHLSKFHIYALVYCIGDFLSGLLHSV